MNAGEIYAVCGVIAFMVVGMVLTRIHLNTEKEGLDLYYRKMLIFFAVFCLVDAGWGLGYGNIINNRGYFIAACYCFHIFNSISSFLWIKYVIHFIRIDRHPRLIKILDILSVVLFAAQITVIASNVLNGQLFSVGTDNEYVTGISRNIIYLIQYMYYILIFIVSLRVFSVTKDEGLRSRCKAAVAYSCAPLLFGTAQLIFFDVAMLSLGFAYTAVLIFIYRQTMRIEELMNEQFDNVSHEHLSIISGLAGDFSVIYYVNLNSGTFDKFSRTEGGNGLVKEEFNNDDFFELALQMGKQNVVPEDMERFLLTIDKRYLLDYLNDNSDCRLIFRLMDPQGYRYTEYKFALDSRERMVVGVYDVDEEYRRKLKEQEELDQVMEQKTALEREAGLLDVAAHRDIMTGLFNRRAYEDHLAEYGGMPDAEDFVYVSLDVNGLKAVNDDLGHDAGDELIKGAAFCMKKAFGVLGRVYRHGGDEFSAILHVDADGLQKALEDFESITAGWSGSMVKELAVSYGATSASELPGASIEELEKLSDSRMYDYKTKYYATKGIDRRMQAEAYDALRESYTKVLKVDLKNDTFAIIKTDEAERTEKEGFSYRLSEWFVGFARSGNIHPGDYDEFTKKTDLQYLRRFFVNPNAKYTIRYKRKWENSYRESMMEIIPSKEYSEENQIVFLYVKYVDGDGLYLRLQELMDNSKLTVQMSWEHDILEFDTELVKKTAGGIYVKPHVRQGNPLKLDIFLTDAIQCNLFAVDEQAGGRIMWPNVEIRTNTSEDGEVLYYIYTREFNQYSRPGEMRIHERTPSDVEAQVTEGGGGSYTVVLNDISHSGLSFYSLEELHFTSDIVNVRFVDTQGGETFYMEVPVRIVRDYRNGDKFFYGCRVLDPDGDYRLYVFLHKLSIRE